MSDRDLPRFIKILGIAPKFTALLSLMGSSYILRRVCKSKRNRMETYQRIMGGMSFCDCIQSLGFLIGSLAIPRGHPMAYGAMGTHGTCVAEGFFNQLVAPCTPLYAATLGIYYVLLICLKWSDKNIRRFEMGMHALIASVGISTAIAGLQLNLYQPHMMVCWISENPLGCNRNPDVECQTIKNPLLYQIAFYIAFGWISFIIMTVSLICVYISVYKVEKSSERYRFSDAIGNVERAQQHNKSLSVFKQGVWYFLGYTIVWFFPTLRILSGGNIKLAPLVRYGGGIFYPLQGFFNFFIYTRPNYLHFRRRHPETSPWKAMYLTIFASSDETITSSTNSTSSLQRQPSSLLLSFASRTSKQLSSLAFFYRSSQRDGLGGNNDDAENVNVAYTSNPNNNETEHNGDTSCKSNVDGETDVERGGVLQDKSSVKAVSTS